MVEIRRAVVTGSSSGIGAAIVRQLLVDGWRVDGLDRQSHPENLDGAVLHRVDLNDLAADHPVFDALLREGAPDALIHAAGLLRTGPLGELDADAGALMWRVHVQAVTCLADRLMPAMIRRGSGRVVLIGSRVAQGVAGRSQYAASKAALVALARSWAAESIGAGVTVNVISPAATETPMLQDPARRATPARVPPLGRFIQAEEVASLAAYLLGDQASAITGQDIAICGGASVRS